MSGEDGGSGGGGGGAKDEMPRVVTLEGEREEMYGCIISSTQAVEAPGGELVVMCGNGRDVQHYYPYHIPGMKL